MSGSKKINVFSSDYADMFFLVNLGKKFKFGEFDCGVSGLNDFLSSGEALTHQQFEISQTFLLLDKENANIVGYFSFSPSSIRFNEAEQAKAKFKIPFMNCPCVVIGKFAVDKKYREKYSGMGTLLMALARSEIREHIKTPLLSLDANTSENEGVDKFYKKLGFEYWETGSSSSKMIKMWYSYVAEDTDSDVEEYKAAE